MFAEPTLFEEIQKFQGRDSLLWLKGRGAPLQVRMDREEKIKVRRNP
jgi:uncharacterized protein (AIM24 family)